MDENDSKNLKDENREIFDFIDDDLDVEKDKTLDDNMNSGQNSEYITTDNGDMLYIGGADVLTFDNITAFDSSLTLTVDTNSPYLIYNTSPYLDFNFVTSPSSDHIARLEQLEKDLETEERLRDENPVVKELYEEYCLALALVADQECDKYFAERMRAFGGKVDEE